MQVLSVGEVLWDVFPDGELLGGAALNFCVNTVRLGGQAALMTAVGCDDRGTRAFKQAAEFGVQPDFFQSVRDAPTGTAHVSFSDGGEPHFSIPRPVAFDFVTLSQQDRQAVQSLKPDWVYFGTLLHMEPRMEALTVELASLLPESRFFYDMNLRPHAWSFALVQRLSSLASVIKLNEAEARVLAADSGKGLASFSIEAFCEEWSATYEIESMCVTHGSDGCSIYEGGHFCKVPGYPVTVKDTVGAGDGFAAAYLYGYDRAWPPVKAGRFANAVGATIASRAGALPRWSIEECFSKASIPLEEKSSR